MEEDIMEQVTIGKTGMIVQKNGFGALPIQRVPKEEAVQILCRAFDGGINIMIRHGPIR